MEDSSERATDQMVALLKSFTATCIVTPDEFKKVSMNWHTCLYQHMMLVHCNLCHRKLMGVIDFNLMYL